MKIWIAEVSDRANDVALLEFYDEPPSGVPSFEVEVDEATVARWTNARSEHDRMQEEIRGYMDQGKERP